MNKKPLLLLLLAVLLAAACQPEATTGQRESATLTALAVERSSWTPVPSVTPVLSVTATPLVPTSTPSATETPTDTPSPTSTPTSAPTILLPTETASSPTNTPPDPATAVSTASPVWTMLTLEVTSTPRSFIATNTPASTSIRQITPTATGTLPPTGLPTLTPSIAPTVISTLIPGAFGGESATWTPPPPTNRFSGNFLFRRPFDDPYSTFWARTYSYGSTDHGQRQVHHGVDISNPSGTPILAAGDGKVYFAGSDTGTLFGPQPDFYGNLVVIEHPFMYSDGSHIYSLYGHMSQIAVQQGEQVKAGQMIGYVGSTGVAEGAHLHFEVRIGNPTSYNTSRNPELWLQPYANTGVLAGRVTDIYGNRLEGVQVEVKSPGSYHMGYSYTGTDVNGDSVLNENFVVPDIPMGYQTVTVSLNDGTLRFRSVVYIWPGQVSWIDIHIQP